MKLSKTMNTNYIIDNLYDCLNKEIDLFDLDNKLSNSISIDANERVRMIENEISTDDAMIKMLI